MQLQSGLVFPRCRSIRDRAGHTLKLARRYTTSQPCSTPQAQLKKIAGKKDYRPKKVIFSGIQPTGTPHLGNYLGALRTWKTLQNEKSERKGAYQLQLYFSIVDLHALTVKQDAPSLLQQRKETFASLLALGLDPKLSVLFYQSHVAYHTELMWILSTVASTGYLSRMTQWKSKLGLSEHASIEDQTARENLRLGLFSYPVLQAADILLYNPTHVPVGEDQVQHIEFTRNLARSFNAHYGSEIRPNFFNEPSLILSPARRIMSLKNPSGKMSKSDAHPDSRILITDPAEEIHRKVKVALTDSAEGISYDLQKRPGVSNLVQILKHVTDTEASCEELAADHQSMSMRAFKEHVAQAVVSELDGISDRFRALMEPQNRALDDAVQVGANRARSKAGDTMNQVQQLVGLKDIHPSSKDARQRQQKFPKISPKRQQIKQEQENEAHAGVEEPDVLPQQKEGMDQPVAS